MFMENRTRRVFTAEYKAEAVRLAKAGSGNIAATARQLGIDVTTLRDWLRRDSAPESDTPSLSPSEKQELLQLRRDNAMLRMEREILKNPPEGLRSVEPETPRRAMAASVQKERPSAFW
jgi:transposase